MTLYKGRVEHMDDSHMGDSSAALETALEAHFQQARALVEQAQATGDPDWQWRAQVAVNLASQGRAIAAQGRAISEMMDRIQLLEEGMTAMLTAQVGILQAQVGRVAELDA